MAMFSLGGAILLVCMRTRHMVCDANTLKEGVQFLILTTPIGLHGDDLFVKKAFNMVLEVMETLKNIRLLFEEINPCKFAEIIDKTHIIFVLIDRIGRRAPHI
jgi:hypothetical protein